MAYTFRLVKRNHVPCVVEECIRPTPFLPDDSSECAVVIIPRSRWFHCETLSSTKGCVLRVVSWQH